MCWRRCRNSKSWRALPCFSSKEKAATSAISAASSASRILLRAASAAMARRFGSQRSWCASPTAFTFGLKPAIAHFKKAVAKAPEFAAGWSSLSLTYEVSFWYMPHMTAAFQAELLAGEKAAADRSAALEPDAAPTEHALGNLARAQFHYADA